MLEYTSHDILKLQEQYNMLLASLEYTDESDKEDLFHELNKIEETIINKTNKIYEEKYDELANAKTFLLNEEKERLINIINLIERRIDYLKNRKVNHQKITNIIVEQPSIKGEDLLGEYQLKIKIIDKYNQNMRLKQKLTKDISFLEEKEKICLSKLKANDRINAELEEKMLDILNKSLTAMDLFSLLEREKEVELAFDELSYAKNKASENLEIAKKSHDEQLLVECSSMFSSISLEYSRYFEKKMLLELLKIYDKKVNNYSELLAKREKMHDIFKNIANSDFYKLVSSEMEKQYNTIKLEEQDVDSYKEIIDELEIKRNNLKEIEEENNSEKFKTILDELIQNEKIREEQIIQERRRQEYEERQRKLIEESKRQEEKRKKQKIVEEARKKEIEKRTRELLEDKMRPSIIKEDRIKENEVEEPKIKSSMIESKSKTVFVPKEVVFDEEEEIENDVLKKEEMPNNRDEIFDSIFDEMQNNFKDDQKEKQNFEETSSQEVDDKIILKEQMSETNKDFSIPVIKNDNLVAKKVKEEQIDEDDMSKFIEKYKENSTEDNFEIKDVVFPDMPI